MKNNISTSTNSITPEILSLRDPRIEGNGGRFILSTPKYLRNAQKIYSDAAAFHALGNFYSGCAHPNTYAIMEAYLNLYRSGSRDSVLMNAIRDLQKEIENG